MTTRILAASTIFTLAALAAAPGLADEEHQYVGARKCSSCHSKKLIGNQVDVWRKSAHANAYDTLAGDRAQEVARKAGVEGKPQKAEQCLRCHVTGYGLSAEHFAKGRPITIDGVGCESCHGPGSDYKKKKVMADADKARSLGLKIPEAEDCQVCHNAESPTWDPNRYPKADGTSCGFDFEAASEKIAHPIPKDVKGHYLELSKKKK